MMAAMVVDQTFELLSKAQRASLNLAADTFNALVSTTRTGLTNPEELAEQLIGFLTAAGDVVGMAAQPLQTFIERQQELADTMANLAELHSQLADVVETVAKHHKGVVDALEALSSPVLGFATKTESVVPSSSKKKPAKRAQASKRS